jgi:hypothetical protein
MTTIPDKITAYAQKGRSATCIPVSVILAQWILETGGFTSDLWRLANNFAGIKYHGAYDKRNGFTKYPDQDSGFADWVRTIGLGYYDKVRTVAKSNASPEAVIKALGDSPWDAGHYDNGKGPGSSLLALWKLEQLSVFDNLPVINGLVGSVTVPSSKPQEFSGDTKKYYIRLDFAGESLVKINEQNDHMLGRADVLADFLGIDQNSPIKVDQVLSAEKFPKLYIPDSGEWKGFQAITQDIPAKIPEKVEVILPGETPVAEEEKVANKLILEIYIKLLAKLDEFLTHIRKLTGYRCPEQTQK